MTAFQSVVEGDKPIVRRSNAPEPVKQTKAKPTQVGYFPEEEKEKEDKSMKIGYFPEDDFKSLVDGDKPPQKKKVKGSEAYENIARWLFQVPLGALQAVTYPMDLLLLAAQGDALDPEEIDRIEKASEEAGIPFDREKYFESVQAASDISPTQTNLERGIEELTGLPLQPKTRGQQLFRLAGMGGKLQPGSLARKTGAGAATIAATKGSEKAIETGLKKAGFDEEKSEKVAEEVSTIIGLPLGTTAATISPGVSVSRKPSGMPKFRFEKLKKPTRITPARKDAIADTVENKFRTIADEIITESPSGKAAQEIKTDPQYRSKLNEGFKEVQELAKDIKGEVPADQIKYNMLKRAEEKQGQGISTTEYQKSYDKHVVDFINDMKLEDASMDQLVQQYRKNNEALSEYFKPGETKAFNRGKKDALLDYNRAIVDTMEQKFPDSEFVNLFKETNEKFAQFKDYEFINDFMNDLFEGKVDYKKGKQFFEKKGMDRAFKRFLGEEGYEAFKQLMNDFLTQEEAAKHLKVESPKGLSGTMKDLFLWVTKPKIAAGLTIPKYVKKAWNMLLDKPQLIVEWDKGIKAFKAGRMAEAESIFEDIQQEAEVQVPGKAKPTGTAKVGVEIDITPPETVPEPKQIEGSGTRPVKALPAPKEPPPTKPDLKPPIKPEVKPKKAAPVKDPKDAKIPTPKNISTVRNPDITPQGLKDQKKYFLDAIDKAIEQEKKGNAPEGPLVVEIPGDGTFKLNRSLNNLNKVRERVDKKWPTKPPPSAKPKTVPYPRLKKARKKPQSVEDINISESFPQGQREAYNIKDTKGKPQTVTGTTFDNLFGIHRKDNGQYSITHLPIGASIVQAPSLTKARQFLKEIYSKGLVDDNFLTEDFQKLGNYIRENPAFNDIAKKYAIDFQGSKPFPKPEEKKPKIEKKRPEFKPIPTIPKNEIPKLQKAFGEFNVSDNAIGGYSADSIVKSVPKEHQGLMRHALDTYFKAKKAGIDNKTYEMDLLGMEIGYYAESPTHMQAANLRQRITKLNNETEGRTVFTPEDIPEKETKITPKSVNNIIRTEKKKVNKVNPFMKVKDVKIYFDRFDRPVAHALIPRNFPGSKDKSFREVDFKLDPEDAVKIYALRRKGLAKNEDKIKKLEDSIRRKFNKELSNGNPPIPVNTVDITPEEKPAGVLGDYFTEPFLRAKFSKVLDFPVRIISESKMRLYSSTGGTVHGFYSRGHPLTLNEKMFKEGDSFKLTSVLIHEATHLLQDIKSRITKEKRAAPYSKQVFEKTAREFPSYVIGQRKTLIKEVPKEKQTSPKYARTPRDEFKPTSAQLKEQKKFAIDIVDELSKAEKGPVLNVMVPGDGDFQVPNTKSGVDNFKKAVRRWYPTRL